MACNSLLLVAAYTAHMFVQVAASVVECMCTEGGKLSTLRQAAATCGLTHAGLSH